tara:strand:+ start:1768 stop:2475 length:708 start_codon:yes stop_codon:yes gene_type:complete
MKKLITLLLLIPLLTQAAVITNGGFETGDLTGWTFVEPSNTFLSDVQDPLDTTVEGEKDLASNWNSQFEFFTPNYMEGSYSFFTGFDGSGPQEIVLSQRIGVIDSESDAFSFDIRGAWNLTDYSENATGNREIKLVLIDYETQETLLTEILFTAELGTTISDTGIQNFGISFTQLIGHDVELQFVQNIPDVNSGPAMLQIDNLQLSYVPIPEASSYALLLGFLGFLYLAINHRNS